MARPQLRCLVFLRLKDGELENNREFRKTLVRVLRQYRPELLEEGLMPHAVNRIYFFGTADPNTWIDIGETIEAKIAALRAHKSQVGEFEDLSAWVKERFGHLGKKKGFAYAETFRHLVTP